MQKSIPIMLVAILCTSCGGCDGGASDVLPLCEDSNTNSECYAAWEPALTPPEPSTCQISLCLTGAVNQNSGLNAYFHNICEYEPIPGLLEDCELEGCYKSFDSFIDNAQRTIYPELFGALDTNTDGKVDDQDDLCEINLITFSWGGPTAVELTRELGRDERVAVSHRRVTRLLMLDPYQPNTTLTLPNNIDKVRVWRQSASPKDDCSSFAPGEPYRGLPPICPSGMDCKDINISRLDTTLTTTDSPPELVESTEVGHCEVPRVARDWVMEALFDLDGLTTLEGF